MGFISKLENFHGEWQPASVNPAEIIKLMLRKKEYRYFRLRGAFFANSLPSPMGSKREAKEWIKGWLKVDRLPVGTEIW